MKLTIVGGGGFRTPLVFRALLSDAAQPIDHVTLVDDDPHRLAVIDAVLRGMADGAPNAPAVEATTDLRAAVSGADFVFAAIRAGGLDGRVADENIPLAHGILGQETVGIGGILYALRSIPAMMDVARTVAEFAPTAWLINFTNPAGMVTEALQPLLPGRVIGICDSPAALIRRACRALRIDENDASYDYVGLNHLGWLRALRVDGTDLLPGLLADGTALNGFEEGQLFGADLLRSIGALPNEYLHYFYYGRDVVESLRATTSRASFLSQQQSAFYRDASATSAPYSLWQRTVDERNRTYMAVSREAAGASERAEEDVEGGGYEQIALAVMRAIANDSGARIILNVPNGATIGALDADAVVEVPCRIDARGVRPLEVAALTDHQAGLIRQLKAIERWTISAAVHGDRDALHAALATHPLNGSYPIAMRVLDEWLALFPEIADRLR
ncbi:MAG: 6-phospho-beta-glucosidase [Cumulibacter sp.]